MGCLLCCIDPKPEEEEIEYNPSTDSPKRHNQKKSEVKNSLIGRSRPSANGKPNTEDSGVMSNNLAIAIIAKNPQFSEAGPINSPSVSSKPPESKPGNLKISSKPSDEIFSSVGLKNLGNTCFMNSIIQILVHLPEIQDPSTILPEELLALRSAIKVKKSSNLPEALTNIYNWISRSMVYKQGEEQDPKYLFWFLAKTISSLRPNQNFFKWSRSIQFTDTNNHKSVFPDQDFPVFPVHSNERHVITCDELNSSLTAFWRIDKHVDAFCDTCKKTVIGDESIIKSEVARYAVFHTSTINASCSIEAICDFRSHGIRFELKGIVMRIGSSTISGHNYSICKESSWVEYNDERVTSKSMTSILEGVYMLFYKVLN